MEALVAHNKLVAETTRWGCWLQKLLGGAGSGGDSQVGTGCRGYCHLLAGRLRLVEVLAAATDEKDARKTLDVATQALVAATDEKGRRKRLTRERR